MLRLGLGLCCRCLSTISSLQKDARPLLSSLILSSTTSSSLHVSRVTAKLSPTSLVLVRNFKSSSSTNKPQEPKKIPFWQRLLIVSSIGGLLAYIFTEANKRKKIATEETRYKELSKAKLGGDWTLTNHFGVRQSNKDFLGQWVLIYFGFTHCPDICPEELEKLTKIVKNFDENPKMPQMQPIFITVDPERDSPSVIKDYCAAVLCAPGSEGVKLYTHNQHQNQKVFLADFKTPRLIGFTGTEEEIKDVAKKFRVYHSKGVRDADNDYIVDHTIIIYLVNPDGQAINYFDRSLPAEQITQSIIKHINLYNEMKH